MKLAAFRPKIRFEKKWPDIVAGLLHAIAFVLGGMLLARWIWLILAPTVPVLPLGLEQSASGQSSRILSGHWFGVTAGRIAVVAPATVNFKLMGVYAPTGSKLGFAIFKMADGKQRSVLLHQEITPGIQLHAIKSDAVEVGSESNVQTLTLESRKINAVAQVPIGFQLNSK